MPAAPNLPTAITAGTTTGHATDHQTIAGVLNAIYKASIGTTRTAAYTLVQDNSGELIPINSVSSVPITVPALQQGSAVSLLRQGSGAVTLVASGVTFLIPAGATATPRVQGSVIDLLWLTSSSVLVSGDLT